jgi:hypothetical protein
MFELNLFEIVGMAAVFMGATYMLVLLWFGVQDARIRFGVWSRTRKQKLAAREAAARITPVINVTVQGLDELAEAMKASSAAGRAMLEAGFAKWPVKCRANFASMPNFAKCPRRYATGGLLRANEVAAELSRGYEVRAKPEDAAVHPRFRVELARFDPKWFVQPKSGPWLSHMSLAVKALRRMRRKALGAAEELKLVNAKLSDALAENQKQRAEIATLKVQNSALARNEPAALPPRLPALFSEWQCNRAPEIGEPPTAMDYLLGRIWIVEALKKTGSEYVVSLVGKGSEVDNLVLHFPLETFREYFSRPDIKHKDS